MIKTTVPSGKLRPGRFFEFDVTSGARGLVPIQRKVALVGGKLAAGTQPAATPVQVFSEIDGDTFFGAGSELALMIRSALRQARKLSLPPPQIWAVGISDAGGAVKATYTLTITGPATASGTLNVYVAGRLVSCPVTSGDSANTIAANLKAAFDALAAKNVMPVTAAVVGAVVTLTANNAGPVGADIRVPIVPTVAGLAAPAGVTCTPAAGTAGTGAYDIQASLDALVDKRYNAMAFGTHIAGDITKAAAHITSVNQPQTKLWSSAYFAEYGSVSTETGLATGANRMEVTVVGCRDFPSLPGEIAAAVAVTVECEDKPSRSMDGVELDLPPCPITSVYIDSEIETLLNAGVTPLVLNKSQDQAKIVRWVCTLTTLNGAAFLTALDGMGYRTLAQGAEQMDAAWARAFIRDNNDTRTQKRVYSVTLDTLKVLEDLGWIQNVDAHKGELEVDQDPANVSRDVVGIPYSVVPALHQLVGVFRFFLEQAQ